MLLDYNDSIYSNNIISYNINLPVTNRNDITYS